MLLDRKFVQLLSSYTVNTVYNQHGSVGCAYRSIPVYFLESLNPSEVYLCNTAFLRCTLQTRQSMQVAVIQGVGAPATCRESETFLMPILSSHGVCDLLIGPLFCYPHTPVAVAT